MTAPTQARGSAATTTATGTTTAGVAPRPRPAHAGPPADEGHPPSYRARPLGLRLSLRPRTVRARIVSLLMVPVVSLLALWGFATVTTAQQIDSLVRLKHVDQTLLQPVGATVGAVQAERTAALAYLAAPGQARMDAYDARARATDAAVAAMAQNILRGEPDAVGLAATLPARIGTLDSATASLKQLRARIEGRQLDWANAATAYAGVVDSGFGVVGSLTGVQNSAVASDARVVLELSQAREMLAREDAAVQSAQAAGRMSPEQYQEFTGARYARRALDASAAPDLRPADLAAYRQVTDGQPARSLAQLEDTVRASGGGPRAVAAAGGNWQPSASTVQQQLDTVLGAAGTQAGANVDPYSLGVLTKNGAAVLFGLAAVVLSLLISVRIGRGLVIELVGLRNSALELAGRRLPAAMRRLRAGEEIDIEAEAPVVEAGDDEIGQVGEALNTVQRAALTAAVERAEVLSGVSGVFVNLARRSQVLVHRQLTLLDAMERRTEDPSELEDLFRLDHLTTRMRRHAEGLIILSGAAPGRAWRKPVPLLDVVRSAVAEVEDYSRVDVRTLPGVSVVGAAVADLTHLVAELVENATGFSPPHTKVLVSGEQVGAGYAVEIEDRGLGMGKEAIAEANRRIADAQQADLFDSDRLGLFVVSRLARRHGVRVSLRPSAYGGTTAVVLLPSALLETGRARRRAPLDAELDLPPVNGSSSAAPLPEALGNPVPAVFPQQNSPQQNRPGQNSRGQHGRPGTPAAPAAAAPAGGRDIETDEPLPFGRPVVARAPGPAGPTGPAPFGRAAADGAGSGQGATRPADDFADPVAPLPFGRAAGAGGRGGALADGETGRAGAPSPSDGFGKASAPGGAGGFGDLDADTPAPFGPAWAPAPGGGTPAPGAPGGTSAGGRADRSARGTGVAQPFGRADDQAGADASLGPVTDPAAEAAPFGRPATAAGGRAAAPSGGPVPARDGEDLPRRVRQASLAVQLREAPLPERPRSARAAATDAAERSPEQARATMSALRDGFMRGRRGHGSGGFGGNAGGAGPARHLRLHQDEPQDTGPDYDDFEDFERSAADGRDDEPHR